MNSPDQLDALLQRRPDERDDAWIREFSPVALDTGLVAAQPPVHQGPDGFQYYTLRLPMPGYSGPLQTLRSVLDGCTTAGMGCVMFRGDQPAYVFGYGQLWALREDGLLYDPDEMPAIEGPQIRVPGHVGVAQ